MEKSFQQRIVNNIRGMMGVFGWDYSILAKNSGISEAGIRKMLSAQSFRVESLEKISDAFGIPNYLLFANLDIGHVKQNNEFYINISWWFSDAEVPARVIDGKTLTVNEKINPQKITEYFPPINKMEDEIDTLKANLDEKEDTIKNQKEMISTMMEMINTLKKQVEFWQSLAGTGNHDDDK
jgi:hypothetical protein